MSMTWVGWIMGLFAVGSLFWHGMNLKERATAMCRRVCREFDLQLLDDTVVYRGMRRVPEGRGKRIAHVYRFEFSVAGADRCSGEMVSGPYKSWSARLNLPEGPTLWDSLNQGSQSRKLLG